MGEILGPANAKVEDLAPALPVTVLVQVAVPIELDVQPDEGEIAALAAARDRATTATARAEQLDAEASQLIVSAEMTRLTTAGSDNASELVAEAASLAAAAHRRYLDSRARADEAWRVVRQIDPTEADGKLADQVWIERT